VKTAAMRISDTLSHFPDPLFHFEDPTNPPQPIPGTASRPSPTADGSDLIGMWFNEPDEGVCQVISVAPHYNLLPETGNHDPTGPTLAPGYHFCLHYRRASGAIEFATAEEIAMWVDRYPFTVLSATTTPPAAGSAGGTLYLLPPPSPTYPIVLKPCDADINESVAWQACPDAEPTDELHDLLLGSPPHPPHLSLPLSSPLHVPLSAGDLDTPTPYLHPLLAYASDTPTLNLDSKGLPLRYNSALKGPNRDAWIAADVVELVKLVFGTGTLRPVHVPSQCPTYYNRIVKEKYKATAIERRVRGTAGGDKISFPYSVSSSTAGMTTFKCLCNDVVSTDSNLANADASDFYLGTPLPNPESIKIYTDTFDSATLDYLGFTPFIKTDSSGKHFVYCDILTTLYGLACSGLLSHLRLLAQLFAYDYIQTSTPCLFRHRTRDITFCLVVDDLAIKYNDLPDLQHLTACLGELFHIKVYPVCTSFLGFTVDYDRTARTLSLSYPSYIPDLLQRLRPNGIPSQKSPCIYTPPVFGSRDPQVTHVDDSPPASPAEAAEIRVIVGSLLYYARAVDATLLTAVCLLSSHQAQPTKQTVLAANRLLGYAKAHPSHSLVYHPSDMLLRVHSDASYLSRPNSGSTAGGFHYLGSTDPTFLNAPIFCHSTRIPVVCAAVSEAEYAAIFANAQVAADERVILSNLGYPQSPTPILCDNECAIGLATETVRPKKSKSIDMRFDWIKCRVRQHQYVITFVPGAHNLADFFTKPLPVHIHVSLIPVYVTPLASTSPAGLSVTFSPRLISDTGATHVLLRRSSLPFLRHLFTPSALPSLSFSLPNGDTLPVSGHNAGTLTFPHKPEPVDCYVCEDHQLAHNLIGTSPLLRPDGTATYTNTSVEFHSPSSALPFLTGSKLASDDLWFLNVPPPP
jgi:hypothetical protein